MSAISVASDPRTRRRGSGALQRCSSHSSRLCWRCRRVPTRTIAPPRRIGSTTSGTGRRSSTIRSATPGRSRRSWWRRCRFPPAPRWPTSAPAPATSRAISRRRWGRTAPCSRSRSSRRLIAYLRDRAEREQLANVAPLFASLDNPRLPPASIDLILIADTYHHLDHRRAYLPLLIRALRPGGRIAVVDWKPGKLPEGPEPSHKLAPREGHRRDARRRAHARRPSPTSCRTTTF